MDTGSNSPDAMPIPVEYKRLFTDRLVARLGTKAPDHETIELAWGVIESATWDYRQAVAAGESLDVAGVSERAIRLTEQLGSFGLGDHRIADIFDALIAVGLCAGFIGIARDQTLIPATAA